MRYTRAEAEKLVDEINRKSLQLRLTMAKALLDKKHYGFAKALIDAVSSEIQVYMVSGEIMSEGGRETFDKKA